MLLAIDCGNTQTVIGLFDDRELVDHWRIATAAGMHLEILKDGADILLVARPLA